MLSVFSDQSRQNNNSLENRKLKEFFDNLNGYVLITNTNAEILYANKSVENEKNVKLKDIIGKKPGQLWGTHSNERFYKKLWYIVKDEKQPFVGKFNNFNNERHEYKEELHIAPLFDKNKKIQYFIEVQPSLKSPRQLKNFSDRYLSVMRENDTDPKKIVKLIENFMSSRNQELDLKAFESPVSPSAFLEKLFLNKNFLERAEDQKLVENAHVSHENFEELYYKYKDKIFSYFYFRVGQNKTVAEDLMQDTFTNAFNAIDNFKLQDCTYLSYLLMIAHNLLVNYYRAHVTIPLNLSIHVPVFTEKESQKNIELQRIWESIDSLPWIKKTILKLKYMEDLSIKDIAEKIGKSENATKLLLSRARKRLKKQVIIDQDLID